MFLFLTLLIITSFKKNKVAVHPSKASLELCAVQVFFHSPRQRAHNNGHEIERFIRLVGRLIDNWCLITKVKQHNI
jgi:hypothetical protein